MTTPSSPTPDPAASVAPAPRQDIARLTLAVLCLLLLIVASLYVLRPFLAALVWATTVVVATWPLFRRLEARFHRRAPAVAVMTLAMLLLLIVPFGPRWRPSWARSIR